MKAGSFFIIAFGLFCIYLLVSPAEAQPVIYSRSALIITPSDEAVPTPPMEKKEGESVPEEKTIKQPAAREPHRFNAEIRSFAALYTEGMFSHEKLADDTAVMFVSEEIMPLKISRANLYAARDILFIANDGTIVQIMPDIIMAELDEDIVASEPVRAALQLRAGLCKQFDIRPKDKVVHELFKKKPVVIQ